MLLRVFTYLFIILFIEHIDFTDFSFNENMTETLVTFDFEIYGRVQGVFFRKCTLEEAQKLGIRGWCKNTYLGTVQGQAEGPKSKMKLLKDWLQNVGSPMSKIESSKFENEREIKKYSFDNFDIIKKQK